MTSICVDQLIRWHTSFWGKSSSSKKIRINIHMLCWWTRRPELTSFVCLLRFDSKQGGRTWPNGNVNKVANNGTFFSTWNSRKDLFWYMWWSNSGVTDATYATTRDDSKDQTTQWRHLAFFLFTQSFKFLICLLLYSERAATLQPEANFECFRQIDFNLQPMRRPQSFPIGLLVEILVYKILIEENSNVEWDLVVVAATF